MTATSANALPEGIYTPVPTFFKGPHYSLDLDAQLKHAKMLYDSGINGLVVAGSMGESIHLTREERCALVRAIRESISDPNFKIIAGLPSLSIEDTLNEIADFAAAKADYAIILVPGYFGPKVTTQQGIFNYFNIISSSLELPIIIYNYPNASNGVDVTVSTFEKLLTLPNIAGVKLTHFNLDKYTLILGATNKNKESNFRAFTGLGQVLLPSLSVGAYGAIDGLSGIFPKSMLKLFELCKENKINEARKLQHLVTEADEMILNLNLVGVKYALKSLYDLGESTTGRPPLDVAISSKVWSVYEDSIKRLFEFEKSL